MEQDKENMQPEEEEMKEKCQNVCIFKITFITLLLSVLYIYVDSNSICTCTVRTYLLFVLHSKYM